MQRTKVLPSDDLGLVPGGDSPPMMVRMARSSIGEGTVLVGTDGSERAQRAVMWAAHEAVLRGTGLTILTAWTPERLADATLWAVGYSGSKLLEDIRAQHDAAATDLVEKAARAVRTQYPELPIDTRAYEGDARKALIEHSREASLLVVGSRGSGPVASVVLGSVAFWLTRHAEVPLAVVPVHAKAMEDSARLHGVVASVDLDPLSSRIVDIAAQEALARHCDLALAYCAADSDAALAGWERATAAGLGDLDVTTIETLAERAQQEHPQLLIRHRLGRGSVDHFLADISACHELLVLGRHHATAVIHESSCVVLIVPVDAA